jgi:hypothetical protein
MNARDFAKTHHTDQEWVAAMGDRHAHVLTPGQQGTYSGFKATVVRHYHNGMYDIQTAGGVACVDGSHFVPATGGAA